MLTADFVDVRRQGTELRLPTLDAKKRLRVEEVAAAVIAGAAGCVGRPRDELDRALSAIDVGPREVRLRDGLAKLLVDGCAFEEGDSDEAERVRREVFVRAARERREQRFDRARILDESARELGHDAAWVERTLYSDLKESHVLLSVPPATAPLLASTWETGRVQAVLLRATRVAIEIRAPAPVVRALFRKLKFLRLLHTITRTDDGHRVVVDGPMSLFESATKYGLQLALLVPALDACDFYAMVADVRWGKERTPLLFRWTGGVGDGAALGAHEDDAIRELREGLAKLGRGWKVKAATQILDLPGEGLCIPDLTLEKDGTRVHVEVLGFWSRDAVWRRVELAQKGLPEPVVFAVSARLRVSEAVLPEEVPASLYVYKGVVEPAGRAREGRGCGLFGAEIGAEEGPMRRLMPFALVALLAFAATACRDEAGAATPDGSLQDGAPAILLEGGDLDADLPDDADVPDAEPAGPRIYALALVTPVLSETEWPARDPDKASDERKTVVRLGYLRKGSSARVKSETPLKKPNCSEGWWELVDGGFVCGKMATPDAKNPGLEDAPRAPYTDRALPYDYGMSMGTGTPLYYRIPTRAEREKIESTIPVSKPVSKKKGKEPDPKAADPKPEPKKEPAPQGDENPYAGVTPDGDDTPWFLKQQTGAKPKVSLEDLAKGGGGLLERRMVKGFYVALDKDLSIRRRRLGPEKFWRTTHGLLAPYEHILVHEAKDDMKGVWLDKPGAAFRLPLGFVIGGHAHKWKLDVPDGGVHDPKLRTIPGAKARRQEDKVERFTVVNLTGKTLEIDKRSYFELEGDGGWLRDSTSRRRSRARAPPT